MKKPCTSSSGTLRLVTVLVIFDKVIVFITKARQIPTSFKRKVALKLHFILPAAGLFQRTRTGRVADLFH